MILCDWDSLPNELKKDTIRPYYDALQHKKLSLVAKRFFDIFVSLIMLIMLSWMFFVIAIAIKLDSNGPVFFRQTRVTQYGKHFKIHKFRTMFQNSENIGALVTTDKDSRVTRVGKVIRKYRLDEICQLIDVFRGDMSFVGVRPEVPKYVSYYTDEMKATLLLPAGVTNITCIKYKDEAKLLSTDEDVDRIYIEKILPSKMIWNLQWILDYTFWADIKLMFMTFLSVLGSDY